MKKDKVGIISDVSREEISKYYWLDDFIYGMCDLSGQSATTKKEVDRILKKALKEYNAQHGITEAPPKNKKKVSARKSKK